jgi:hypothetical protein
MQFLFEVMANKLPNSQESLLLNVEDFIVRKHIWMLVEVECSPNLVNLSFVILELIVLKL